MAQLLDHVDYLSQQIGARPAGTEEEHDAALYIADQLQKESGYHAEIEEFTGGSNLEGGRAILSAIVIVASVLAMLFHFLSIPAFVLVAAAAAVYVLEAFDKPYVSRALSRAASQNVVAKYKPAHETENRSRSRKVVLVAHYDSGRVKPALVARAEALGLPLGMAVVVAMCAAAVLMLLRVLAGGGGGPLVVILNVLTVVAIVISALPAVKAVLYRMAPYNEGANNNATGVAALIEVARRISEGSLSEAELTYADETVIYGADAAMAEGLLPEGAELRYEVAPNQPYVEVSEEEYDSYDEEERLQAAKAAIAALTGRPVEVAPHVAESREPEAFAAEEDELEAAAPNSEATEPAASAETLVETAVEASDPVQPSVLATPQPEEVAGFQNAPSWFVAAQKNAKKSAEPVTQAQRSKFTEAIDEAAREREERDRQLKEQERRRLAQQQRALDEQRRREEAAAQAQAEAEAQAQAEAKERVADQAVHVAADQAISDLEAVMPTQAELDAQELPSVEEIKAALVEVQSEESAAQENAPEAAAEEASVADPGSTVAFDPRMFDEQELAALSAEGQATVGQTAEPRPSSAPAGNDGATAKGSLTALPSIEPQTAVSAAPAAVPETTNPSRSGMFRKLRTDVPSLSGVIRLQDAGNGSAHESAGQSVSAAADRPKVSLPSVQPEPAAPATEQAPTAPAAPDAEDVQAAQAAQATPANQPGKVEMPSSRAGGLLGRFRNKGGDPLDETPQEWLDVDQDFDARTVGRERGGWESFRDESGTKPAEDWQGGAVSRVRLGHVDTRSGGEEADTPTTLVTDEEDRMLNDEIDQIIHFRNPQFNTEVWFAAIGSDTELHDGAKAFLETHRNELRGAMIIEVESLGAGALSAAIEEGQFQPVKSSSRIKRFTRAATEATGIALDYVKLNGVDSIASTAQKAGMQAIHLFGAENGQPALKGDPDDFIENVDELVLAENVDYLTELVRSI